MFCLIVYLRITVAFSQTDSNQSVYKTKIKWTSSEPLQNKKFYRNDKGDVAHLGSENVILKGYQPLNEYSTLPRPQRERSGSDPTSEVHLQPLQNHNSDDFNRNLNRRNEISRSQNFNVTEHTNNCTKVYINGDNEIFSFEGLIKQNELFSANRGLLKVNIVLFVDPVCLANTKSFGFTQLTEVKPS